MRGCDVVRLGALTVVGALVGLCVAVPPVGSAEQVRTTPLQAMDGDVRVSPGTALWAGIDFSIPGPHPVVTASFTTARVSFPVMCVGGRDVAGTVVVPLAGGPYVADADDNSWLPSGDQDSTETYQGSTRIPDLCSGGLLTLKKGGSLAVAAQTDQPISRINLRWHYMVDGGKGGGWSGTVAVDPAGPAVTADPPAATRQIVVKLDIADGYTIERLATAFPVAVDDGGLASRGIYLVHCTDPQQQGPSQIADLARRMAGYQGVVYAEPNLDVHLADTQLHAWPYGTPGGGGSDVGAWADQPVVAQLRLEDAHAISTGAGVTVAVLDTGVDATQPALAGHVLPGWNYVEDDADTADTARESATTAVGHGTFVAGLIALVAPQAKILPERVLDSGGDGTLFGVAQAIADAVTAGAQVINLSFGTPFDVKSHLLHDAVQQARKAGVVVVAAAGNDADNHPHFPAAHPEALSVGALADADTALASFSDWGGWVDVAAPGDQLIGPLPGDRFATWSGTSMAAPIVAGQAALILAEVPKLNTAKLFAAVETTADPLGKNTVRYGRIDILASLEYAPAHR